MITQDLNTLKLNLMSNEKFEEKQANESLVENEIYLTPAPKIDAEPIENSKNLITSGGVFEALKNVPTGGNPSEGKSVQSDWAQTDSTKPNYIKNKPGDYIEIIDEDLRNYSVELGAPMETSPFALWRVKTQVSNLQDIKEGIILKIYKNNELIDEQELFLDPILDNQFIDPSSGTGYWALINANQTVEQILSTMIWTEKNESYPTFIVGFIKNNSTGLVNIHIGAPANLMGESFELELNFSTVKRQLVSLPDSTLSKEFLNIDGKLHLAYGKTQIETVENDTEASLALGTPLQQQGNPFLMWRAIYTIENYPYDLLKDKVQISYINSNNEQIIFDKEHNPLLLELNSTLDQAFGIGTEHLGHWGIFNSKQTIMELFGQLQSGGNIVLEKYEENEPAIIVVLSQSQEDRNIYITLVSLENIYEIYSNNFIINILNEQINETVLKLPKEALPDDISAEVEMVQSDYAENDETKDSYIQNRPFYDYPVQTDLFPRVFEEIVWDGNVDGKVALNNETEGTIGIFKISDNFISINNIYDSNITTYNPSTKETTIGIARTPFRTLTNQETGSTGYGIGIDPDKLGLTVYVIYQFQEAGIYTFDDDENASPYIIPEAGIYFSRNSNNGYVKSWKGCYDFNHEDIIPEFKSFGAMAKKISDIAPDKEDWYNISYILENNNGYKIELEEYIFNDITNTITNLPNSKKGSYMGAWMFGIKESNYALDLGNGNTYTFTEPGLYIYSVGEGTIYSYQLANKINKKYIYQPTVETYNKIESGNSKPVSSSAVWNALGGRNSISIDDENLPIQGSQKLMTSNAIYKAFEQMNQNKQDTLTILDSVQENSDGIVKSSGIYNAIEEIKNDVPTATSHLTNDSNFVNTNQLNSAVQEVMNVANGKRASHVVKDEAELNAFIASNRDDLKIGDIFLLTDANLPDYWWTGSDIAVLETDIDLDNYYNQNQVDNLLSQKADAENHYTKTEVDSQFNQRLGDLIVRKAYSSQISNPVEGTIYYNTNNKTIQVYTGGSWSSAVAADPNTIYFVVEE